MTTTTLKTIELLETFGRGQTNHIALSEKQAKWLCDVAKAEGLSRNDGTGTTYIHLPDCRVYLVRQGSYLVSGYGGTRGTRPSGRYSAQLHYHIRFKSTGLTSFYRHEVLNLKENTMNGHEFEIYYLQP